MKQSTIWTIVIVVILVVLSIILISIPKQKESKSGEPETQEVIEKDIKDKLKQAKEVVPGGSLATKQGEVITETGQEVKSEALPGSLTAPKQSRPLKEEEVPKDAIKLTMNSFGFIPNEFTVAPGSVVTLSVTARDERDSLVFKNTELIGITIDLSVNQTRAVTFKAPTVPGDYTFASLFYPDRKTGIMHVK